MIFSKKVKQQYGIEFIKTNAEKFEITQVDRDDNGFIITFSCEKCSDILEIEGIFEVIAENQRTNTGEWSFLANEESASNRRRLV